MRVLIIFNHPAPYKVNAFNELAKYVDLTIIFERTKAKDRPDSFYKDNKYNFNVIFLKDGYVGNEGTVSSNVKNYISKLHHEYDIIIMNGYSHLAEIKAINYMHKHHIKFGLLINGGVVKKETCLKRKYKTSLVKKPTFYISPSQKSNEYLEYYGADKSHIYNYYYSNFFKSEISSATKEEKDAFRKKYNLPLNSKIFINPSQFIERKNILFLISLFKDRKYTLLLVGSGKLQKKYEQYIAQNNMKNVIILPYQKKKELFELYKACDVHITLSKQDIFGHTVLESFANGVPVISSKNVISAMEYIKNGYNGYIVDLDDKESIIKAMDKCDSSMGENAMNSAYNNTFENSALSIYQILKDLHE